MSETAVKPKPHAVTRSRVSNGKRLHVAGDERGAWARRFRDLVGDFVADLGGIETLSAMEHSLIRSAVTLAIDLERMSSDASQGKPFDPDVYGRALGNYRRSLETIGLKRKTRTVELNPLEAHFAKPPERRTAA